MKNELMKQLEIVCSSLIDMGKTSIKAYEIAFQDVLENYFEGKCWWQVCSLNIFNDLLATENPYETIDNILSSLKY